MNENTTIQNSLSESDKQSNLNDLSIYTDEQPIEDSTNVEQVEQKELEDNNESTLSAVDDKSAVADESDTKEQKKNIPKPVPYQRFKQINDKYKETQQEVENLKKKLEEYEEETEEQPHQSQNINSTTGETEKKYKYDEIDKKLDERDFFKKIDINNRYDKEKILDKIQPIAEAIFLNNKSDSYLKALHKAYKLDSIDIEANKKIEEARKNDAKIKALGTSSSSSQIQKDTGLTNDQIKIANEMGIPLSEYRKYI